MSTENVKNEIPEKVLKHLTGIAAEQGLDQNTEYINNLIEVWKRKVKLFRDQINSMKLQAADEILQNDARGIMVLTYSGSLLSIGPVFPSGTNINFTRWMEYSSIKLRTEVPDILMEKKVSLASPPAVGKPVEFSGSRIRATSPVYLMAVCPDGLDAEEQDKRIRESSVFITAGFMACNRSLLADSDFVPDQFTMKAMTRFLAKKHGLTGQAAKLLIDDFMVLIETGMLMGESVPFGRLGKFSIKTRDAQKPRVVRHPATGEKMTVEAKPARGVPRISFSSYIKERAAGVVSGD